MKFEHKNLYLRVASLSALAGMRSMSGPALLSLDRKLIPRSSSVGQFFSSPYVTLGISALAVGEMFADKLPFMPNRTSFPALCARALSGAVIGASLYAVENQSPSKGALIGGASAVAATYVSFHIRRTLTKTFHIPDFLVALAEDSLIVGKGMKILERQLDPSSEPDAIDMQAPGHHGMMH